MRNRAAWELTERHQSLVTRTETLINELHSAGPAEAGGKGGGVPSKEFVFHGRKSTKDSAVPRRCGFTVNLSRRSPYSDAMTVLSSRPLSGCLRNRWEHVVTVCKVLRCVQIHLLGTASES